MGNPKLAEYEFANGFPVSIDIKTGYLIGNFLTRVVTTDEKGSKLIFPGSEVSFIFKPFKQTQIDPRQQLDSFSAQGGTAAFVTYLSPQKQGALSSSVYTPVHHLAAGSYRIVKTSATSGTFTFMAPGRARAASEPPALLGALDTNLATGWFLNFAGETVLTHPTIRVPAGVPGVPAKKAKPDNPLVRLTTFVGCPVDGPGSCLD